MTSEDKQTVLIIEDDLDVADMLNAYFRVQGYSVVTANWGQDGVKECLANLPDLIILDIRLPDIDGFEVARQIRSNRRTDQIPIIFLTEKRSRNDRLKGLELGADDYITKPFDIQELRLRVRNALRRASQGTINNPITGLAEKSHTSEKLGNLLEDGAEWAAFYIMLENLEGFRETYGFVASDDVLRAVSLMLQNALRDTGHSGEFLGHLEINEFLMIIPPSAIDEIKNQIKSRIEQSLEYFYPIKTRESQDFPPNKLHIRIAALQHKQVPGKMNLENIIKVLRKQAA